MKASFTLLYLTLSLVVCGQYITPGTGLLYNLEALVSASSGTVTGSDGNFEINAALTIAANDTLRITTPDQIAVAPDVLITIEGALIVDAEALFTVQNCCDAFYEGIRLEASAHTKLQNATFEYGGGIRVLGGDFEMDACTVRYQTTGASTGGAIGLSSGKPKISSSLFLENESAAISSSANIAVAPLVQGNTFTGNNTGNTNRPQINLGPSGADTTLITNNTVIGYPENEQAGGIGFSSLTGVEAHALISGNVVTHNRYGIAVIGGNIYTRIENNTVEANITQNDPNLGGSGININAVGENGHVILGNSMIGNLWGLTLQGEASVNLGELENPNIGAGNNLFADNGNNGTTYALFNNTPNSLWAQENCWDGLSFFITEELVEEVIFHSVDNPDLGEVFFSPFSQCIFIPSAEDVIFEEIASLFPNPASDRFTLTTSIPINRIEIITLQGLLVLERDFGPTQTAEVEIHGLASGCYLVHVFGTDFVSTGRIVVE